MKITSHRRGVNAVSAAVLALALIGLVASCATESRAGDLALDPKDPNYESKLYPTAWLSFDPVKGAVTGESPGGYVKQYVNFFETLDAAGVPVRIEGVCASACTFAIGLMDPSLLCATDAAVFQFHGVYSGAFSEKFEATDTKAAMALYYPEHVREVLATLGFDGSRDVDRSVYPDGVIPLSGQTLAIRKCAP